MTTETRGTRDLGSLFPVLLLILLLVLGGLAAGAAWLRKKRSEAVAKARADLKSFRVALTVYEVDNADFPDTAQGLDALLRRPTLPPAPKNWRGPYWEPTTIPFDPWGNPYVYRWPGLKGAIDLYSCGPDGQPGTADDIRGY